jgi:hypothetical protein
MSWKKYFKVADVSGQLSPISGKNQFGLPGFPRQQGFGADAYATGNDFAFRNYLSIIEQRMSFADFVPAGQKVRFDLDDFLRGSLAERIAAYKTLYEIGALSIDEIREEEDLIS